MVNGGRGRGTNHPGGRVRTVPSPLPPPHRLHAILSLFGQGRARSGRIKLRQAGWVGSVRGKGG